MEKDYEFEFSIVILTFNRKDYLDRLISQLINLSDVEIIVVDNCSDDEYAKRICAPHDEVELIRLDKNYGAVGRNFGMAAASGRYVITLDDDVWGITKNELDCLRNDFIKFPDIGAICFKVMDEENENVINWSHPVKKEEFLNLNFDTCEISEGAVAIRRLVLDEVGLYPEEYFISHEGPDLALRVMDKGYRVTYNPNVAVVHAHATEGRTSWRRYYYDTRNSIWLAYRLYNKRMIFTKLPISLIAMFIYSLRDGFLKYYFKAIKDGIIGIKSRKFIRSPISGRTYKRIRVIKKNSPSLFYYLKNRLFNKSVRI